MLYDNPIEQKAHFDYVDYEINIVPVIIVL